tara:strand:- start:831 stop:1550 length:720 start_codon:yes stop_codon:yes gene_type:complete
MTTFIPRNTVMRLLQDIKDIIKNPLDKQGIFYKHDEEDMLIGRALIIGPKDTPYENGFYFFKFQFPTDYPTSPPKVTYLTNDGYTRFNPNFYRNGKVCLSVLNTWKGDQWSGCQGLSSVLLTLVSTFNEMPLCNEPGFSETHRDVKPYNNMVTFKNYQIAILGMIGKEKKHLPEIGKVFTETINDLYKQFYNDIINNIKSLSKIKFDKQHVGVYNMSFTPDYDNLLKQFIELTPDKLMA